MPDQQLPAQEEVWIKDFLEKTPPGQGRVVKKVPTRTARSNYVIYTLPLLELHCETNTCSGTRFFESADEVTPRSGFQDDNFLTFRCRNCGTSVKTYALRFILKNEKLWILKLGEEPAFGPPTPAKVFTLIGDERDYYLKGRRAENQGLGIGAFAYYRRVVENQKDRILDAIIRVAEKLAAPTEMLNDLADAKKQVQFKTAVGAVKHGIPQALLVDGHNPLILLHAALSQGLHAQTDEECLELATSIRLVLTDLAERLGQALKEHAELNTAVSKLMSVRSAKSEKASD